MWAVVGNMDVVVEVLVHKLVIENSITAVAGVIVAGEVVVAVGGVIVVAAVAVSVVVVAVVVVAECFGKVVQ